MRLTHPSESKDRTRALDDLARLAHGDLGSSAADIDVHDPGGFADRACTSPRAERGESRLERIARAHRYELAGLGGEQLADRAGVAAPDGDAREDQGARVDRPGVDSGEPVLPVDEAPER